MSFSQSTLFNQQWTISSRTGYGKCVAAHIIRRRCERDCWWTPGLQIRASLCCSIFQSYNREDATKKRSVSHQFRLLPIKRSRYGSHQRRPSSRWIAHRSWLEVQSVFFSFGWSVNIYSRLKKESNGSTPSNSLLIIIIFKSTLFSSQVSKKWMLFQYLYTSIYTYIF